MRRLILLIPALVMVFATGVAPPASMAHIFDPCSARVLSPAALSPMVFCPQGDGTAIEDAGGPIVFQIIDGSGYPVPSIPATDVWLLDCDFTELSLCNGILSVNATGPSDENGTMTIAAPVAAAGCISGLAVVAMGSYIVGPENCIKYFPHCIPTTIRSPDRNRDMVVDIIDFSLFGIAFPSPPASYDACFDFDDNGEIDLVDFATFGIHFLHGCSA